MKQAPAYLGKRVVTLLSRPWVSWALFMSVAITAAVLLHSLSPNIIARDALYHLGHAARYLEDGPFQGAFPWLPYSVVGQHGGDIWYGFHVLLAPVTLVSDPTLRIKVAGAAILVVLLALAFAAARVLHLRLPALWPLALVLLLPWRLSQVRPNALSIGLAMLLFALLHRSRVRGIFAVSFALSFVHLAFFWLALMMVAVVGAVRWVSAGSRPWRAAVAVGGGLLAGWLLRPRPLGTARVLHVQLVQLMQEKGRQRLAFGRELFPMGPRTLLAEHGPLLIVWLVAVSLFLGAVLLRRARLSPPAGTVLWSAAALGGLFLVMTLGASERAVDLWAPFAILFLAAGAGALLARGGRLGLTIAALGFAMLVHGGWSAVDSYVHKLERGVAPDRLRRPAEWLREHSPPRSVIFHVNWGIFPELFYWNQENRYIGGMDPIFQYAYAPNLYWKVHHLFTGRASRFTWGSENIRLAEPEPTGVVLRRDFDASFVLLEKGPSAALYRHLKTDSAFTERYDEDGIAIFALQR